MIRTASFASLLVCLVSPALAQPPEDETMPTPEEERAAREDALFADEDDDESSAREATLFGGDGDEPGLIQDGLDLITRVNEKNDLLQLGGQLYMRLDWATKEEGEVDTFPLSSPSLLDLYLDVRPTDQLRAYVRGRVAHDFSVDENATTTYGEPQEPTKVLLDQLWLKFDIAHRVFLTLGQQPIRWGHGRFWNPTDFLNRQFKDPLAVFDERLGVALIKVHVPIESLGWNFYAIADLDKADSVDKIGAALRAEFVVGTTEIAASFAARRYEPYRLGLSVSTGFWLIDAWAEAALLHDIRTPRYEGSFDLSSWTSPDLTTWAFPTERDVSSQWWPRTSAGFELSIPLPEEDALYIGVEYAFNGLGYDDASLYPLGLVPFYTGKHYGAAYIALPAPGRWDDVTFTLSQLANLSDESYVTRFDTRLRILTYLDLNIYAAVHFGKVGEFNYSARFALTPQAANLLSALPEEEAEALAAQVGLPIQDIVDEGITIPAPLVDIGLGLRLRL